MKASIFYRTAAILLLLFAVGHTLGFREPDPQWHADAVIGLMRSIHFDAMGSSRTYWDFYLAAGYIVGLLYLFAALLAWQLGGLSPAARAAMRLTIWGFALCFAGITVLSSVYLFIIPAAFSVLVTLFLTIAAWLSGREAASGDARQ